MRYFMTDILRKIVILVISATFLCSCSRDKNSENLNNNPDNPANSITDVLNQTDGEPLPHDFVEADMSDYPCMANITEHNFVVANPQVLYDTINSDTCYVFFGFSECSWCNLLLPIVNEKALEQNIYVIYLDAMGSEYRDGFFSVLINEHPEFQDEEGEIHTPQFLSFKDGVVVKHMTGIETDPEEDEEGNLYLTDEGKKLAASSVQEVIDSIKD